MKKDINIRIEDRTLTVTGERKFEKEEKEENYRRVERRSGSFSRTFTLPTTVDTETFSADYEKGVLEIRFQPRRRKPSPSGIKVNVGGERVPWRASSPVGQAEGRG